MLKRWHRAVGYLAIFLVPALVILGITVGMPSLAFATVMLVFPLARYVFGSVGAGESAPWHEAVASFLHHLPFLYAAGLVATIAYVLRSLSLDAAAGSAPHAIGLGLSLWIMMVLSTCVAHELIHRRLSAAAMVGHFIAGLAGYPVLGREHLAHHARPGDAEAAEWPRVDESMWRFALRRLRRVVGDAYGQGSAFWNPAGHDRSLDGLRLGTASSIAVCGLFAWAGGATALAVYLGAALGVMFSTQLITYIQHWGLGNDRQDYRSRHPYAWEDDCRFQAWVTLCISLHQAHHERSQRPYYLIAPRPNSPRLPASYVIMMVLCLFPRLWFKVMLPVLEDWEENTAHSAAVGRRPICFARREQPDVGG